MCNLTENSPILPKTKSAKIEALLTNITRSSISLGLIFHQKHKKIYTFEFIKHIYNK